MPIDANILLQGQPVQLQSPLNMLARAAGVQNMMQQSRLQAMQMQDVHDQRRMAIEQAQARQRALANLPPPPDDAPGAWKQAHQAAQMGLMPVDKYIELVTKPAKLSVAAPGSTIYNESTGQVVNNVPDRPQPPSPISRLIAERDALPPGDPRRSVLDAAIAKESTHAPAASVSVNTGQKGFDNTLKLRGEFKSEPIYKAHQEMQSAYSQIQQSLKQASPAGDLAGATKIMKLLDPGSVVRESELGMAIAANGLFDRVTNYAQMVLNGTKLTPNQRKDFQTLADALYGESVKQYNAKRDEYQGIAARNQLPEVDVIGNPAKAPSSGWSIQKVD